MKRAVVFGFALASFATPALAAHWNVDMAKSRLGFTLPWGKEPFVASFKSWNADIAFDPADLAHAHVTATIAIGSEGSGDSDTDDSLKGDQGFGAEKFPTARFDAKAFQHLTGNAYAADGTLTIHGMTRPVHMAFTLTLAGNSAHMIGDVQTKWADYGLGKDMGSEMPPDIGQTVTIHVDLTASKS